MMRRAALALMIVTAGGCASQGKVDVYLVNVTPMPSTLFEQRARLELRVQNLSDAPLEATGLDVALQVNGRRLARGVDGHAFIVPRMGEALASVVVSTSVFDTVKQILGMRERQVFTYTLKGKVVMAGGDRRFSKTGEISRADLLPLRGEQ